MPARFFVPHLVGSSSVELEGSEAHHLLHVLRCKPGEAVELFDGHGQLAKAEITHTARKSATLTVHELCPPSPALPPELVLATAVPKGDRFRWLVEKTTELGIDRIQPLHTERSVVSPKEQKLDKLEQTAIAACKQCGRLRLPVLASPLTWEECLQREQDAQLLLAHPGGLSLQEWPTRIPAEHSRLVLCVGPEGGWTDAEVERALAAGAQQVSLGNHILRIETAAIAFTTLAATLRPSPDISRETTPEA